MEITTNLRERFCKDCKIPIKIYERPYFSYQLVLFDKQYNCVLRYNQFKKEVAKFNTEEEYDKHYRTIKESVMDYIKNNEVFQRFVNETFEIPILNLPKKDIYKEPFINRKFLSIDMIKANFNALLHYNSEIFDNNFTWEDFMRKFTDSDYIINSKYIREVVFGNCNCEQQLIYERLLMSTLVKEVYNNDFDIVYFSNDEVVIDITDLSQEKIDKIINNFFKNAIVPIRADIFTLQAISVEGKIKAYLKCYDDGIYDIKKYDSLYLPCIIKYLNNDIITEEDLVFMQNGTICRLLEIPHVTMKQVY